ncbi:2-oxoglutarate dehydrogenase complex dihydrolipoyllysine-residue succinyltransferase [Flavobacterium johnsoniae]|uniref:Dihydrolipoyllysine-residue succinyltransferase component of 2-oxoglutarate dehydrogenase complex n=1 Tax=Flavobacterium johnsoniae (strain ATCC 17061 / DSM 2064 / JCM 8514 / BCRC 14874 / CCUG 350202 / NBRC 14942 / NCIMB 11054 / UW101) TaxID=376686 RepID=A5FKI1_FLAJ1|nr:2-oxoglutarate dehydrogenase complex dihydrolipoyllysine-residue succinyltransferase [Flavobacterium johnsoniae]ABQ04287.1 2-oxoglutarate dehydrogenase, E2 subunit, dihydrolipoamide succinyltransferase [Flavobacterium johnsoniae UW101]OXG02486.1 dihydrolipoamide succinyltransferase [Flavobacterium johnsoniae UW101]WQG83920.1 2-oxoglutarate dehydrogenase complex dihydrolipoyllysine-residue succinyltransferase [Flavobacterium johnsoniae UW101]SHK17892.1 2-oxoglutarate dehydrogenase E2 componen
MILEMKVPSPGESIKEVEIATWLVKDGDYVEKDQAIAEVDSDKATLELPAEMSGVITLKAEEGDTVAVGAVVCLIDTDAAKPAGSGSAAPAAEAPKAEAPKAEAPKAEVKAEAPKVAPAATSYAAGTPSPAARKILDEKNIAPAAVTGTGKGGRITKDDAVNAVPSMGTPTGGSRGTERTKLSMLRRKVAERLVSAKNETAMLTTFNEVNMTPINQIRNEYKDAFKAKHGGLGLGFMSFFTKAVTRALQLYPDVNSMMDGDYKIAYDFADISIAVSGPKGLMVPVVRNAELLTFRGIEAEIKRLALRARDGQITVDDMTGGTFTITNGGVFGSMLSTPIINPPQSGILGMHNIIERPIAVNGKVEIHPMMYVALSYDHRIIDGRESVGFLVAVKEALENPVELLMNGDAKRALEL